MAKGGACRRFCYIRELTISPIGTRKPVYLATGPSKLQTMDGQITIRVSNGLNISKNILRRVLRVLAYRLLILDGHESHHSAGFEAYCKEKNIVTLCLPAHSSHLTQPLDVGCFSPWKRAYGHEINAFIKAHINHISKVEFLIAFKAAYLATIIQSNARAGFRGAGLIPFEPQAIISKLDIKLRTPAPTNLPLLNEDSWTSQTPRNLTEALSQSSLLKSRIGKHQGSSPTQIFEATTRLTKGINSYSA